MQAALDLSQLLETVIKQTKAKTDYLANTETAIEIVEREVMTDINGGYVTKLMLNLKKESSGFSETFGITENAHKQIAARLKIPTKYYFRLLQDHPDLIMNQINALFDREPENRMLRILNGEVRAFLSDKYRRLDNNIVLEQALPQIIQGDIETKLLSSNVTDRKLYLKVLFPDDRLAQQIGVTRDGSPDIVRPGFMLSNSEIGQGSLSIKGFFYRSFCENGCHFGGINTLDFSRSHLGGRVIEGVDYSIMSDETRQKEDALLMSQTTDVIRALSSPEFSKTMGDQLRMTKDTKLVKNPIEAVDAVAKELGLHQNEKDSVLESFIKDQDYSLWGMANAVTAQANNAELCSYDRATELEELGGKLLSMTPRTWDKFANIESVAEAA